MTATLQTDTEPTGDASVKFPAFPYESAHAFCSGYFEEWIRAAQSIDLTSLAQAAEVLVEAYASGRVVYACGNGGSAAIANHLQCDHLKGIRTESDLSPRAVSLSTNIELITAIANDIGYEDVFTYQLQSLAMQGDVLLAISSSGRSANIVRALSSAQAQGLHTIALTGFDGGEARRLAEIPVHVQCRNYGIIEDLHQSVMHALAQHIRQSRMTPDAISACTF